MHAHTNTCTHLNMVKVWLSIRGSNWLIQPEGFICDVAPSSGHPVGSQFVEFMNPISAAQQAASEVNRLPRHLIQSLFSEYKQCSIRSVATPDLNLHTHSSAVTRHRVCWQQAQQWFVCPNWGRRWTPAFPLFYCQMCTSMLVRSTEFTTHCASLTSAVNFGDKNVDMH